MALTVMFAVSILLLRQEKWGRILGLTILLLAWTTVAVGQDALTAFIMIMLEIALLMYIRKGITF